MIAAHYHATKGDTIEVDVYPDVHFGVLRITQAKGELELFFANDDRGGMEALSQLILELRKLRHGLRACKGDTP